MRGSTSPLSWRLLSKKITELGQGMQLSRGPRFNPQHWKRTKLHHRGCHIGSSAMWTEHWYPGDWYMAPQKQHLGFPIPTTAAALCYPSTSHRGSERVCLGVESLGQVGCFSETQTQIYHLLCKSSLCFRQIGIPVLSLQDTGN